MASLVHNYRSLGGTPSTGVIVTTNKSLPAILRILSTNATPHALIVDEIHVGLDEFLKRQKTSERFEQALSRAKKTFLLTGTLTDVQRNKLVDVVGTALSGLTESDYCRYEFLPVKRNPLVVRKTSAFNSDFIALLNKLKGMKERGEAIPRVVLILATSRMEAFRLAVVAKGLEDLALIVSKPENFDFEIEQARTGRQPILIASPLFAVGLNFDLEPDIFWCNFSHLEADENQIIQTLNRANRSARVADVRVYGNINPSPMFRIPKLEKLQHEIKESFLREASLQGILDQHSIIDLTAYRILRKAERDNVVALSRLVRDDAIQNYRVVVDLDPSKIYKKAQEEFKGFKKAASDAYAADIQRAASVFEHYQISEIFLGFDQLNAERLENWKTGQVRLEKQIKDDETGLLINLCDIPANQVREVKLVKLKRLFAWLDPWLSDQYASDRFVGWPKVASEKSKLIANVVMWLQGVREHSVEPHHMASALTKGKALSGGLLSLSEDAVEFHKLSVRLRWLRLRRAKVKLNGSKLQRKEVQDSALQMLRGSLKTIGVFFETKKVDGDSVPDYTKLIVPPRWPLDEMRAVLLRRAASLSLLPDGSESGMVQDSVDNANPPVSLQLCRQCVHIHQMVCARGQTINTFDEDGLFSAKCCDHFRRFKGPVFEPTRF